MKYFYYISGKIGYTSAIALITSLVGGVCVIFGYYLGTSFIIASYFQITSNIIKWLPWALSFTAILYCIQFGLLTPIKIPALFRSFRDINHNLHGDRLSPDISDDELKHLYNHIVLFPLYNTFSCILYGIISAIALIALIYLDNMKSGNFNIQNMYMIIKIVSIGGMTSVIIFAMSTYLLTDILTGRERATCYNELRRRFINIRPRVLVGVRFKFSLFAVLMIITLLTFGALIEKGRFYSEANLTAIVIYFFVSVAAGFLLMFVNTNSIVRIFTDITRVAREIASGGEVHFKVLPLEREFSAIEYAMMEMKVEIDEHRKNLELKVEERTRELQEALSDLKDRDNLIQKQLDMASTIQRSILPRHLEDWSELKFSVKYLAMEKIGGDFYDVLKLSNNKLGILVADVSGHGIPAALVTSMAKVSFSNACRKHSSPKKIFQEVNQDILDNVKTQDYMTCFMAIIDDEYNVTYTNASHQRCIILRTDEERIELLDTGGLFIGALEDARDTYEEKMTTLNYGDRMIMFTDGISEATNEKREGYSTERLETLILENRHVSLDDFTNLIIEDVKGFIGNAQVEDDITLLVVELSRDHTIEIIKNVKKMIADGKYNESIDTLKRGLILYPDDPKLLYNLAKTYFKVNDFEQVVEYISKYIKRDKGNRYALYIGGAAYYQLNDYTNAIDLLEQAISIDPTFINALFALGMVYKKHEITDKAVQYFDKVLKIDTDNMRAQAELKELKNIGS
ncbi:MAG: SpoIIE family protein phosphatase [Spirochaetota bacterium]|nr:SpoIIE family protein phosphatase [Spirochaetota bacterium]